MNFREGMRELGYVEGQNVVIEQRYGRPERLPELADELARLKVDMIVASGSAAVRAAQKVWIELVREAFPKASRIAMLFDPGSTRTQPVAAESAARSLGLARE